MSIKLSVSKIAIKVTALMSAGVLVLGLSACAPEVGSEAWCKQMKEKPSGDWSSNEAADYAKHCVFK
ncbi:DUF3012 domain-containing protein [uncultured Shewanella sp.]|uniref:DUF3012 domain-containing protein n=1 Tax=uncultured Shewanella sp. TaxID=173975 RepID=UPI0026376509|nr:DUF3012 domain-containing protein [uncultured Shewanella sp.]